jgi:RNA polymerase sigma-70 factor (ECF subfamily)
MSDFHLLLQEELPSLMRYATALVRDPDDAGDLVEDTVRMALAHEEEYRRGDSLRLWLLTMLHDLRDNPFRQSIAAITLPDHASRSLTLSQLDLALGQLPEEQRAIILLLGLEGLTYEETAAVLRLPLGTMRARLARGRAGLCRAMGVGEPAKVARAA